MENTPPLTRKPFVFNGSIILFLMVLHNKHYSRGKGILIDGASSSVAGASACTSFLGMDTLFKW